MENQQQTYGNARSSSCNSSSSNQINRKCSCYLISGQPSLDWYLTLSGLLSLVTREHIYHTSPPFVVQNLVIPAGNTPELYNHPNPVHPSRRGLISFMQSSTSAKDTDLFITKFSYSL